MPKKIIRVRKEKIALIEKQIKDYLKTIKNAKTSKGKIKKHSYRNYLIALTWFSTGLRVGEMCNFTVDWIEKGIENYISVKQNKIPCVFKPKYGSTRRIPIKKDLFDKLNKYLAGKTKGYVFKPQSTKQYTRFSTKSVIKVFNAYFVKTISIGRNLGSHTFRRTFASQLAASKPPVPLAKISYYLGHRDVATTVRYLKQITDDEHNELLDADYIKNIY
ncbi:hypothetical protein LCGC14_1468770 [marine sediment metagenome]|uniref:Tyr recombinase domain-containing protein n=1 Tax=marine sediment metagenome TaxID=412755 RepID=A0A0F9MEU4_9ZZZZ